MSQLHVVFGAGQVGRPLAESLLAMGHRVRAVRRSVAAAPAGAEGVSGDAFDEAFCRSAAAGASAVYHCLNVPYTAKAWQAQLPGLQRNLLRAAAAAGARLVVLENLYGYGRPAGPLIEASPVQPVSRKGHVRAALSDALFAAHRQGTAEVVSGRASHLFGPAVTQSMIGEQLFARVLAGKSAQVMGKPAALHSFSYAPDVGRALAMLGTAGSGDVVGRAHLLPVMPVTPALAFYRALFAALGVSPRIEPVSRLMLSVIGLFAPPLRELVEQHYEWEHDYVVDDSAFVGRFAFARTDLATALDQTARWARSRFTRARAA